MFSDESVGCAYIFNNRCWRFLHVSTYMSIVCKYIWIENIVNVSYMPQPIGIVCRKSLTPRHIEHTLWIIFVMFSLAFHTAHCPCHSWKHDLFQCHDFHEAVKATGTVFYKTLKLCITTNIVFIYYVVFVQIVAMWRRHCATGQYVRLSPIRVMD